MSKFDIIVVSAGQYIVGYEKTQTQQNKVLLVEVVWSNMTHIEAFNEKPGTRGIN